MHQVMGTLAMIIKPAEQGTSLTGPTQLHRTSSQTNRKMLGKLRIRPAHLQG